MPSGKLPISMFSKLPRWRQKLFHHLYYTSYARNVEDNLAKIFLFLNFQQSGKKKRGCGGNEFLPVCLPRFARHRVGSGSSLRQQGIKACKISFLN